MLEKYSPTLQELLAVLAGPDRPYLDPREGVVRILSKLFLARNFREHYLDSFALMFPVTYRLLKQRKENPDDTAV